MTTTDAAGRIRWPALLLAAALAACAGMQPDTGDVGRSAGRLITADRIAETGARTAWDALRKTVAIATFTESGQIRRRGSSSVNLNESMPIYVDNVRVMDPRTLQNMPARDIHSIRVLNGIDATTYFGTDSVDGAILIVTRS